MVMLHKITQVKEIVQRKRAKYPRKKRNNNNNKYF